jgi:hypothetical protein
MAIISLVYLFVSWSLFNCFINIWIATSTLTFVLPRNAFQYSNYWQSLRESKKISNLHFDEKLDRVLWEKFEDI